MSSANASAEMSIRVFGYCQATPAEVATRIAAYHDAGADHVALVPSTAEDPAGRGALGALARQAVV